MATDPDKAVGHGVTLPTADGLALHGWHWPWPSPRGVLIIAHGLGEHGGCYRHVAEALGPALGVDVLTFDFRGHGRSPGRRGVVRLYDELTTDLRAALTWAGLERPGLPRIVLGHSNGGQVALRLVLEDGSDVAGLILSNPSIRLAVQVPSWKRLVGKGLLRFAPGVTMDSALNETQMTRDLDDLATRRHDPLRHARISAPLYFGMVEGGPMIAARATEIQVPLLLLLSGSDPVVDAKASRSVFDTFGAADKTLIVYPEMLHEPLNDTENRRVLDDIAAWLSPRLDAPAPGSRMPA
ncbi:MAG: lysophospholipase [Isosphaeraceae bacterium]